MNKRIFLAIAAFVALGTACEGPVIIDGGITDCRIVDCGTNDNPTGTTTPSNGYTGDNHDGSGIYTRPGERGVQTVLIPPAREVTVYPGEPVPNMNPGDTLNFALVTRDECDRIGGTYHAPFSFCADVDF